MSLYLTYQWLPAHCEHYLDWNPKIFQEDKECPRHRKVSDGIEAAKILKEEVESVIHNKDPQKIGILLSSGIDSASVAYCLPSGCHAFYVTYDQATSEDMSSVEKYAAVNGLELHKVYVDDKTYRKWVPILMRVKKSPLHPCEIAVAEALQCAQTLGINIVFAGWGCDTYFGGMDKLLSRDYSTAHEFAERYTYLQPNIVLKNPDENVQMYFDRYQTEFGFDTFRFLEENYHGMTLQSFYYLPKMFHIQMKCPWGSIGLNEPLDLNKIRNGQPKYIVADAFKHLSGCLSIPEKVPFTRPDYIDCIDKLKQFDFISSNSFAKLTPQQKWMTFILCAFIEQEILHQSSNRAWESFRSVNMSAER